MKLCAQPKVIKGKRRWYLASGFITNISMTALLFNFCYVSGCKVANGSENGSQTPAPLVSIGVFTGSVSDEKQLRDLMDKNDIVIGLEGSQFYDMYVPASKAKMACDILRTNELTLRHKINLYKIPLWPN
jgi:hypothetical protein